MRSVEMKLHPSAHGWRAEFSLVTVCALLGLVYVYGQSNLNFIGFFSNALTPFEAFAAFAMAVLAWRLNSGKQGGGITRVYLSYSLGIGLWFAAECTWSLYALALRVSIPFPSLADVFWLVGYIPLFIALLWQAWPFRQLLGSRKQLVITLGMFFLALLLLIVTIPPILLQNQGLVAVSVSVAYPLLDTLLLTVAVPVFLIFRKGSYWRPALIVILGIVLQLVGDLAFNQSIMAGTYYSGSPTDLVFDLSYLMLALGFYRVWKPTS